MPAEWPPSLWASPVPAKPTTNRDTGRFAGAVRPTVSVICPLAGSPAGLERAVGALAGLLIREGDELLVADNRPVPVPVPGARGDVRVLDASGPASSYHARAVAARHARGEWLVFVDADCEPAPDLLDAYFSQAPGDTTAVLAGGVIDWTDEDTRVARYVERRRKLDQATTLAHPRGPYAQTANCAVRRGVFEAVGGFPLPLRSGGDADLCWRLAAAGWGLEVRPAARVHHRNRARLWPLLAQIQRHGTGMRWLDERWPGAFPATPARQRLGRVAMLARGVRDCEPLDAALDVVCLCARDLGRLRSNLP